MVSGLTESIFKIGKCIMDMDMEEVESQVKEYFKFLAEVEVMYKIDPLTQYPPRYALLEINGKYKKVKALFNCSDSQSPQKIKKFFSSFGCGFSGKDAPKIFEFYINKYKPEDRYIVVNQTGWNGDKFLLPYKTFVPGGDDDDDDTKEKLVLAYGDQTIVDILNRDESKTKYRRSGTLEEWKKNVAEPCRGNPYLIFGLACAFASPFLKKIGGENSGFNLFGAARSGKTTITDVAGSVWGCGINEKQTYAESWSATNAALEAFCRHHNNTLLVLDELSQKSQDDFILQSMGQGAGKSRDVNAKNLGGWQLVYLSTANASSFDYGFAKGNQDTQEAVSSRFIDIPISGKHGAFDEPPEDMDPGQFADHLQHVSRTYYGTAAEKFLEKLVKYDDGKKEKDLRTAHLSTVEKCQKNLYPGKDIIISNVAKRFAVVFASADFARVKEILPFERKELFKSVKFCFDQHLKWRETVPSLDSVEVMNEKIVAYVANYIFLRLKDSLYLGDIREIGPKDTKKIEEYWATQIYINESRNYGDEIIVRPGQLVENKSCPITSNGENSDYIKKRISEALRDEGYLNPQKSNDGTVKNLLRQPLPKGGKDRPRCFCVKASILKKSKHTRAHPSFEIFDEYIPKNFLEFIRS